MFKKKYYLWQTKIETAINGFHDDISTLLYLLGINYRELSPSKALLLFEAGYMDELEQEIEAINRLQVKKEKILVIDPYELRALRYIHSFKHIRLIDNFIPIYSLLLAKASKLDFSTNIKFLYIESIPDRELGINKTIKKLLTKLGVVFDVYTGLSGGEPFIHEITPQISKKIFSDLKNELRNTNASLLLTSSPLIYERLRLYSKLPVELLPLTILHYS